MAMTKRPSGTICRLEPENVRWAEEFPKCAEMMRNAGWFSFCEKLRGHNLEVTNAFVKNYKDSSVSFQTLSFKVDEATIAEATGIPLEGERWFKRHLFEVDLRIFLLPGFEKLDWGNGIHFSNVKHEWRDVLMIIQRYITCEGRYATVYRYHLRFLLHSNGESRLNLPYYLFKSIEKMVTRVKDHPDHTSRSVFHHGLIKLLIITELRKTDRCWEHFLFWSGFGSETQTHSDDKEARKKYRDSKRQKRMVTELGNEQSRKDFDAVNKDVSEISTTEVQRKLIIEQQNEELIRQNKELQTKIQLMDAELSRLQKRSQALDGLKQLRSCNCSWSNV